VALPILSLDTPTVVIDSEGFVIELVTMSPETGDLVLEHLADHEKVQPQLLVTDLRLAAYAMYERQDSDSLALLLDLLNRALRDGNRRLSNAIAVSFVDDARLDRRMAAFVAGWPEGLRSEAERQRRWGPPEAIY
jgi:hypothetical protein